MKPKKFDSKLTLKKSTVSDLCPKEQGALKGGYWPTDLEGPCYTWNPECPTKPVGVCLTGEECDPFC